MFDNLDFSSHIGTSKQHISMIQNPAKLIAIAFIAVATLSGYAFRSSKNVNVSGVNNAVAVASFEEVIVEIPKLNEKNQQSIAQSFVANPGVEFRGYCKTFNLLMFVVDRSLQVNNNFVDITMHHEGLTFNIKQDVTIERMIGECGMETNTEENPE